jgi:hypothetical protein
VIFRIPVYARAGSTSIADIEDLMDLREAKQEEENMPGVPLEAVKQKLGLS